MTKVTKITRSGLKYDHVNFPTVLIAVGTYLFMLSVNGDSLTLPEIYTGTKRWFNQHSHSFSIRDHGFKGALRRTLQQYCFSSGSPRTKRNKFGLDLFINPKHGRWKINTRFTEFVVTLNQLGQALARAA